MASVTPSSNEKVAIIMGATGTLGPHISQKLENQQYRVIKGSRRSKELSYTSEQLTDSKFWLEKIQKFAPKGTGTLLLVNLIGKARADDGGTLDDVNVRPVVALAKAGKAFAGENEGIKVVVVQVSAIAATYIVDHPYGKSRADANKTVMNLATEAPEANFKAVVIRFPFIFPNPIENESGEVEIRGLQPWSLEQVAGLPVAPLAGGGNQVLYPVSLEDAAQSVVEAAKVQENITVEARGSQAITQRELIQLYATLQNKEITLIPMPTTVLAPLLDMFPYGLLDGYSPRVMAEIPEGDADSLPRGEEGENFDTLLGRDAQGVRNTYSGLENVVAPPPPVAEHLMQHKGKIVTAFAALTVAVVAGRALWAYTQK